MTYFSVCSGIEAASVAWEVLGWQPVGFSEIEPFPCEVLKQRFPTVKNYGDMTKFKEWTDLSKGSFDLLVGGVPCQAFSLAGMRRGLDDPRGNLTLVFLSMVDYFKPKYVVFENVPGIMSDKTHAFEQLLAGLNKIGYIFDADILDAQDFGVPQRRKRVFVVAINADYINSNFNIEVDYERLSLGELYTEQEIRMHEPNQLEKAKDKINFIKRFNISFKQGTEKVHAIKNFMQKTFEESKKENNECCDVSNKSLLVYDIHIDIIKPRDCKKDAVAPILATYSKLSSVPLVQQYSAENKSIVRRLTPLECERLQGFPDNWTRIKWRGRNESECPSSLRYKACGNSMATPVMQYIGRCINALECALKEYKR